MTFGDTCIRILSRIVPTWFRERYLRHALEMNSGNTILKDLITQYFRSEKFIRHITYLAYLSSFFGLLWGLLYLTHDPGAGTVIYQHGHDSAGEQVCHFTPSSSSTELSSWYIFHIVSLRPFREIRLDEIQAGHIDTNEYRLGLIRRPEPRSDWADAESTLATVTSGKMCLVELDELEHAMKERCDADENCFCISAPHLRVPVRALYVGSVGLMLNPEISSLSSRIIEGKDGISYSSPLGPMKLFEFVHSIILSYYLADGNIDGRRLRARLSGVEATCAYAVIQEFGELHTSTTSDPNAPAILPPTHGGL